jgi:hypothetical protein
MVISILINTIRREMRICWINNRDGKAIRQKRWDRDKNTNGVEERNYFAVIFEPLTGHVLVVT